MVIVNLTAQIESAEFLCSTQAPRNDRGLYNILGVKSYR